MASLKDWYTVEEVTPGLLTGIQRRVTPRQRRILDFTGIRTHEEMIRRMVYIQDHTQMADIRGFTDPSVAMQGLDTEEQVVQPFHVKNHFSFDNESEFTRKQGGEWQIASRGLRHSEENVLEPGRLNLAVYALLSMINDQQFTYDDPDKGRLSVDYSDHIGSLPDPNNYIGSGNFKPYEYTRLMKQNYYDLTGMLPNLVFMNPSVGNDFTSLEPVKDKFEPQAPRDPDPSDENYEEFTFNGIRWVILYDEYPDVDGNLHPAIKNKHMAVTRATVDGQPGPNSNPLILDKLETDENEGDASEPYYEVKQIDNDPFEAGNFLYDNMVPSVSKKEIVSMWQVKS